MSSSDAEREEMIAEEYPQEIIKAHNFINTLDEVISLTFDRLLPKEDMLPLLDLLDEYGMNATFFASTAQIEDYPITVQEIIDRGYAIENNALGEVNLKELSYDEIYQLVNENNQLIQSITNEPTRYVRVHSKRNHDDVFKVANELGMHGVINYSYYLEDINVEDKQEVTNKIRRAVARGGIILMNPQYVELLPDLYEAIEKVKFNVIPLDELLKLDEGRKPFEEIEGSDAIQKNLDFKNVEPFPHYQENTDKKEVALTFDDWASEAVVLEVLDILERYDIQSTFYLKTKIVKENPNLARLIVHRGHEVANHTHEHYDSTEISIEQLQDDVYTAHKIITEAIQEQPKLYFRPPFGRIDEESAKAIAAMGFDVIGMYDISSYDWNAEYTKEDVINRVMSNVQPGSVIVMHILNDIHTPEVLPDVIEALQAEGYEFVLTSDWVEKDE